jgi:hypothetical protein
LPEQGRTLSLADAQTSAENRNLPLPLMPLLGRQVLLQPETNSLAK